MHNLIFHECNMSHEGLPWIIKNSLYKETKIKHDITCTGTV